ncbi:MAG: dockerin type I domain-containing protein, partial [Candidatus Bathyarchaeaceae archaeon]
TMGTHMVFVDNVCWGIGNFAGYRYTFLLWEDGSTDNPRTITVVEDTTIKAYFDGKWCPGDVDGSGKVDWVDQSILGNAYGSWPGDSNWDSRCDLDGSGAVDWKDLSILGQYYGNIYP